LLKLQETLLSLSRCAAAHLHHRNGSNATSASY